MKTIPSSLHRISSHPRLWQGVLAVFTVLASLFFSPTALAVVENRPGIVIWLESTAHSAGTAKIFSFSSYTGDSAVTKFIGPRGEKLELDFGRPRTPLITPDESKMTLLAPGDLGPINDSLRLYVQALQTYPQHKDQLSEPIRQLKAIIGQINAGRVILQGTWMSRKEYDDMLQKESEIRNQEYSKNSDKRKQKEEEQRRAEIEALRKKR